MSKRLPSLLKEKFQNALAKPNPDAILIFGFQKTGSSALCNLLSKMTGFSLTCDTEALWEPYFSDLWEGRLDFTRQVKRYSSDFSKDIIKEPQLTFLTTEAQQLFSCEKYVFIVRNPFDNIRSILDRLGVDGSGKEIDLDQIPYSWQLFFRQNGGADYVGSLAQWWVKANDQLPFIRSPACHLIRYEDFADEKIKTIERVAERLELPRKYPIDKYANIQYQPKGNPDVDLEDFFGAKNHAKIKSVCGRLAGKLGYEL